MRLFQRQQLIPTTIHDAWGFISDPRNLSRITPLSLDFKIISQVPLRVHEGLTIEYRVKPLFGIPVQWVSVIKDVHEPYSFVDEQLKGPYASWQHTHVLKECEGGVMMEDVIKYAPPGDRIFPFINGCLVVPQLNKIFDFRAKILKELFP